MTMRKWEFYDTSLMPSANDLVSIYKKYVLLCPVKGMSQRAKSFSELGWSGAAFNTLRAEMLRLSTLTNETWIGLGTGPETLTDKLVKLNMYKGIPKIFEFACYCKGDLGKTEALFYLIRNALAHGSFLHFIATVCNTLHLRQNAKAY